MLGWVESVPKVKVPVDICLRVRKVSLVWLFRVASGGNFFMFLFSFVHRELSPRGACWRGCVQSCQQALI